MVGRDYRGWRYEKAERFLRVSRFAFEASDWETTVSKAYYATDHAVIALLEQKAGLSRSAWQHTQLRNDFRREFAQKGFLFTVRHARDFDSLYEERLVADYEEGPLRRQRADDCLRRAQELCDKIGEVLRDV